VGTGLPNGNFELQTGWTLSRSAGSPVSEYADFVSNPVYQGSQSLFLRHDRDGFGGGTSGSAISDSFTVPGAATRRQLFGYIRADTQSGLFSIGFQNFPNGTGLPESNIYQVHSWEITPDTWTYFEFTLTTNGPDDSIKILPQRNGDGFGVINWHIDDLSYGDTVAVKLAERAVDSIVALLQSQFATELAAIDTDRGDGLTMAAPTSDNYYKYNRPELGGGEAHVEVFEEEDIEFLNPTKDISDARAQYRLDLVVRVTWFNRNQDTLEEMMTRGRRYAAGVFNTMTKNHLLADSDDATQYVEVNRVTPPTVGDVDEDGVNIAKGQTSIFITVPCEEIQT